MKRYRAISLFFLVFCIGVLFFLFHQYLKNINEETDIEVQKQKYPRLPQIKLQVEFLPNIFSPVFPDIKWFSNAGNILDALTLPGGILAATSGGLVFYSNDAIMHKAGRTTGLPFTSSLRLISTEKGIYAIGDDGILLMKNSLPQSVSGHRFYAPGLNLQKFKDAVTDGDNIFLLTDKGVIYRLQDRSIERICELKKQIPTSLAIFQNRLYVGTVTAGLFSMKVSGKHCEISNVAKGAKLGEIKTLFCDNDSLWICTANGLYKIENENLTTVFTGRMITGISRRDERTIFGTHSGELFLVGESRSLCSFPAPVSMIRATDQGFLIGTEAGLYSLVGSDDAYSPEQLIPNPKLTPLVENYVTALALDKGNLLIGGLNTGLYRIDIHNGLSTPMVPNEPGISAICKYGINKWMLGTTTGFIDIDSTGKINRKLNKKQGLIHSNVTAILPSESGIYAATAAGLSRIDKSQIRSIYAFHGLINNHLYTLAPSPNGIWVGTLGGLCEVGGEGGLTVSRCLSEKEGLSHPWITALESNNKKLFIGSYGGGIMILDKNDKLFKVPGYQKACINLNASAIIGSNVCFGSLERGMLCVDKDNKLFSVTKELPSNNVTALAADNDRFAVGTDSGAVVLPLHLLENEDLL